MRIRNLSRKWRSQGTPCWVTSGHNDEMCYPREHPRCALSVSSIWLISYLIRCAIFNSLCLQKLISTLQVHVELLTCIHTINSAHRRWCYTDLGRQEGRTRLKMAGKQATGKECRKRKKDTENVRRESMSACLC